MFAPLRYVIFQKSISSGTGLWLALAIARQIVNIVVGEIDLDTDGQNGARFGTLRPVG